MEINKNLEGNKLTLALVGRLDTATAPALEETLKDAFASISSLVLDFAGLEYISSAGLRVLLMAQKNMASKEGMVLTNVNDTIREVFEMTGFLDILNVQ